MVIDIDAVMLMVYMNIYEYVINAPSTAHGARSAAATELRRSCDGVTAATESLLRRSCADQLRRAHSAQRVRDGADAAATGLMLRAALLRRSRCCDGAAQTTSVALILRVASRRDALNEEPASFPPVTC